MAETNQLTILYDGNCPICRRKKAFLQRRDRRGALAYADIRTDAHLPRRAGVPFSTLEKQIHALRPDGELLAGMDVIRAAYREIGLGWLAAPTAWPLLRPVFDALYGMVARNRQRISRFFRTH